MPEIKYSGSFLYHALLYGGQLLIPGAVFLLMKRSLKPIKEYKPRLYQQGDD